MPAMSLAGIPASQPTTQPGSPDAMAQWFAELASSDAGVRDSARLNLMLLKPQDLPGLGKLVRESRPLAPAQAMSLRDIVQEIFLSGLPYDRDATHGFLGILMDTTALTIRDLDPQIEGIESPGVVVADRIPGFCAARRLLDGDVILGLADSTRLFRSAQDLKQAIGGLEPGRTVRLRILRHGQVIDVPLTLDAHPLDIDQDGGESFRVHRAEKFNEFWQRSFAPLLKEDEVTSTQVNAGK